MGGGGEILQGWRTMTVPQAGHHRGAVRGRPESGTAFQNSQLGATSVCIGDGWCELNLLEQGYSWADGQAQETLPSLDPPLHPAV